MRSEDDCWALHRPSIYKNKGGLALDKNTFDPTQRNRKKGVLKLRGSRDISKIVWPDDRDSIFLQWLAEDAALLQDAGFSQDETKRMLATLKYVRIWSTNPPWLFPIKKLPKGYCWRDGQKFSCKRGRRYDGYSYIFLPIGEDLYVKGMVVVGTKASDCPGAKIKHYKNLTSAEVSYRLSVSPDLDSAIHTFWHSHGLEGGYVMPILRSPKQYSAEFRFDPLSRT